MARLITFFDKRGREAAHHQLSRQLHAYYKAVEDFREKDHVKGRRSHLDIFCKKGFLKKLAIYKRK